MSEPIRRLELDDVKDSMRLSTAVLIVLTAAVALAGSAAAETIYDADFSTEPLGPLTTQPETDLLPLVLPTRIQRGSLAFPGGAVDVVVSAGDLTQRPVLISAESVLGDVVFFHMPAPLSGLVDIQVDALLLDVPPDRSLWEHLFLSGVDDSGNGDVLLAIRYATDGTFRVQDGNGVRFGLGRYTLGVADRFAIALNMDASSYELMLNGGFVAAGPLGSQGRLNYLGLASTTDGRTEPSRMAFDNLTVVPEPRTDLLAASALSALAALGHRRALAAECRIR